MGVLGYRLQECPAWRLWNYRSTSPSSVTCSWEVRVISDSPVKGTQETLSGQQKKCKLSLYKRTENPDWKKRRKCWWADLHIRECHEAAMWSHKNVVRRLTPSWPLQLWCWRREVSRAVAPESNHGWWLNESQMKGTRWRYVRHKMAAKTVYISDDSISGNGSNGSVHVSNFILSSEPVIFWTDGTIDWKKCRNCNFFQRRK